MSRRIDESSICSFQTWPGCGHWQTGHRARQCACASVDAGSIGFCQLQPFSFSLSDQCNASLCPPERSFIVSTGRASFVVFALLAASHADPHCHLRLEQQGGFEIENVGLSVRAVSTHPHCRSWTVVTHNCLRALLVGRPAMSSFQRHTGSRRNIRYKDLTSCQYCQAETRCFWQRDAESHDRGADAIGDSTMSIGSSSC